MGARGPWPALLTSTSIRSQRSIAWSTRRLRSSLDWFDPVTPMPPSSCAKASPLPEEDRTATLNPSAASLRAAAAPMPLPPAVMIATFSTDILVSILRRGADPLAAGRRRPIPCVDRRGEPDVEDDPASGRLVRVFPAELRVGSDFY